VELSHSSDVVVAAAPRRWVQAIKALVPIAFIAAMVAHALPFFSPTPGVHLINVESGFSAFFASFYALTVAPQDPLVEAFSLPLIAAFIGLMFLRRRGRLGSVGPLLCALVGSTALGSAYFFDPQAPWAYGYYTAEGCFVVATMAAGVRLILLRRSQPDSHVAASRRDESAASASQELLSRYR
jgi:hypothetical protein